MEAEATRELASCPFCGSDAEHDSNYYSGRLFPDPNTPSNTGSGHAVYCSNIACIGNPSFATVFDTRAEAIAAWNTRAALTRAEPDSELVERVARAIDPGYWKRRDEDLGRRQEWDDEIKVAWNETTFEQWANRSVGKSLDQARAAIAAIRPSREGELTHASTYAAFTDGMEAAAQICGSLAETTYDDSDGFEAATGCEAAIMRVVKQQRQEQASPPQKEATKAAHEEGRLAGIEEAARVAWRAEPLPSSPVEKDDRAAFRYGIDCAYAAICGLRDSR